MKKNTLQCILLYLFNQLDIKVSKKTLINALEEQKMYLGSIRGIKEVLNHFEVESKTYRVEYNDLLSIECPIIAHIIEDDSDFVVVEECSNLTVKYYDSSKGQVEDTVNNFLKKWSGVILVPIINKQSGDPEYISNILEEKRIRRLLIIHIWATIIFMILITYINLSFYHDYFIFRSVIILCKILGCTLSALIIKVEFGNYNPIIRQICKNSECEKVIHSKGSKIFSWLSMGDVGIIYFSGGLLLILFVRSENYPVLSILSLINLIALPFTFYSVYYQWLVVKSFCPFCCIIVFLLWIEFFIGLLVINNPSYIVLSDIIYATISYLFTFIVWFLFKPYIHKASLTDSYKSILLQIKKNFELFNSFLITKNTVPELILLNEITLGDINAKYTLIAILSPSCDSCNQLYKELRTYSEQFPERLQIILRFKGIEKDRSDMNKVVDWIITMHLSGESIRALEIYESWNKMKFTGIRKWEIKNQLCGRNILPEAVHIRKTYTSWINSLDIPGTPVLIFYGKILPAYYTFNDIKYLIRQLYEK